MNVQGKLAVITGSSQGLGKAFATKLLEAGALVCLSDINEETGQETLKQLGERFGSKKVHFVSCNVLQKDDIANLYEESEKHFNKNVDIFCNNAGINHVRGWKLCMDIDIMAVMEGTELVLDKMDIRKGGKGGLIVNTASMAGIVPGFSREDACYFIAKHGVVTQTRTLGTSKFQQETGVKVQCICPAFADTAILSDIGKESFEEVQKKFGLMTPEFVAEAFMKLVTKCKTGDAICVIKDTPPFIYADFSREWSTYLAVGSKIFKALFGIELFTPQLQYVFMFLTFILLHLIFNFISAYAFCC